MPHTLLAADDSATIRRVIELTFADRDVTVVTVGDGDAAIQSLDTAPPDIVLADILMPGRSGYDVARHIQSSPALAHIPVMLLAGAFEPVDHSLATSLGCAGVLTKPLDPQFVIRRVSELLESLRQEPAVMAAPAEASDVPDERNAEPEALDVAVDLAPAWAASVEFAPIEIVPDVPDVALTPETADEPMVASDLALVEETRLAIGTESAPETVAAPAEPVSGDPGTEPPPLTVVPHTAVRDKDVEAYFEELDHRLTGLAREERPPLPMVERGDVASVEESRAADDPPPAPIPAEAPRPAPTGPALLSAFSALLAAERGAPAPPVTPVRAGNEPVAVPPTEDLLERVARRALDRLTEDSVREMVERVVAETAERLVREEIERIKSNIK